MEITYLLNSGFMIRDENILLVIDDCDDPSGAADAAYDRDDYDNFYVFVTHAHFDHFGTHIRAYAPKISRYVFSSDIKHTKRVKIFPSNKITYIKRSSQWTDDVLKVKTFDSTDVGISFLIEFPSGKKIFHAGDFNWWHWTDDTRENLELAEKVFKRQLKKMDGLEADVAFFPIDGRLGLSQEMGAIEFVQRTNIKNFVAMHRVDFPLWEPSPLFVKMSKDVPTWAPVTPGEQLIV